MTVKVVDSRWPSLDADQEEPAEELTGPAQMKTEALSTAGLAADQALEELKTAVAWLQVVDPTAKKYRRLIADMEGLVETIDYRRQL